MNKKHLPTITVVIATYNSERTISKCLDSLRSQDYPQKLIDIIMVDGGSKDHTLEIINKYGVSLIKVDSAKQNAEYNKSLGVNKSKGEILFLLDHDNVIPHRHWLRRMILPFQDHPEVVGVETLRYYYDPQACLLDRYFALFGAGDPLAWYLGKADRLSYLYDSYNLMGKAKDCGSYYLVSFDSGSVPTLGANGFLVRRKILMDNAQVAPGKFFHIDVNVDLIQKKFSTYAFVKDAILHLTGYGNVVNFLKRRMLFVEQYYLNDERLVAKKIRRYSVFEKRDIWKLCKFIFISLTFVIPFLDSFKGYKRIHDKAWFLHPFLCFSLVVLYGWVIIKHQLCLNNSGLQLFRKKNVVKPI